MEYYTETTLLDNLDAVRALMDGSGHLDGLDYQILFFGDTITVELYNESAYTTYIAAYPGQ